ncbi:MAG: geranylgeranylglycerol-phosphate geranylgeranyltransferase [Winogradskyella sp.]|uniref:geranylgeranylglycerol-phosphate geranylgeranyltransferase n=1 Tax=Winogradskyella sp. TaxID=1883156 RepID=UPI0017F6C8B0|nr:geranylgeranylglycerol-phosphate geranylgeranyltransferase [Winogradskyella sp.]
MIVFLNLIRWKNLIMIALVQFLIKYALLLPFFNSHGVTTTLKPLGFFLLVTATICIAAGGYIINDVYDIEADKVNKPSKVYINKLISENTAITLFIILNVLGVGIGYYLSNGIDQPSFFVIFIIASALLYLYSSYLKQIILVGNIIVSLIIALSIIIVGVFELLPVINEQNRVAQIFFFKIILDYAIFAFMINLIREMVKDIEDIDGDYKVGIKTLPILLGRERSTKMVFVLSLIPLFSVIYYVINHLFTQTLVVLYFLILVIAPLIYVSIKLFGADQKSHYKHISFVLKLVMLSGLLSLVLYQFILL